MIFRLKLCILQYALCDIRINFTNLKKKLNCCSNCDIKFRGVYKIVLCILKYSNFFFQILGNNYWKYYIGKKMIIIEIYKNIKFIKCF